MKARTLVALAFLTLGAAANAQVLLDHINGTQKDGAAAASQIFTDLPPYDCNVVDDFSTSTATTITTAMADMELFNSPYANFAQWDVGRLYKLSVFASINDAVNDVAVVTTITPDTSIIPDPQGFGPLTARVIFNNLNLNIGPGTYWFGIQGIGSFANDGQIGVLGATYGAGGAPNNAEFVNGGLGFGVGPHVPLSSLGVMPNAKYYIEAVPEPVSMIALVGGLVGLSARRRKR